MNKEERQYFKNKCIRKKKKILIGTICIALSSLLILKYYNFFGHNLCLLFDFFGIELNIPALTLIFPIGLSFYTFQSVGYCIDVYRSSIEAEHNLIKYSLFVSYFPQLLQGPIADFQSFTASLYKTKKFSYSNAVYGAQRAAYGFFKKLVVANHIELLTGNIWISYTDYHGVIFIFILFLYAIQLYADFSGYMDIAIGCSQMLGIQIDENFETPYFAKNITQFWRMWHITLGRWFRNYVFYPLMRSRLCDNFRKRFKIYPYWSSTIPNVVALLIVWCLIGFWHGSSWSYIVYGLYHGFFVILALIMSPLIKKFYHKFPDADKSKFYAFMQICRTFIIVSLGYLIFKPGNLAVTQSILHNIFSDLNLHYFIKWGYDNVREIIAVFLGTCTIFAVDVYHYRCKRNNFPSSIRHLVKNSNTVTRYFIYLLFILAILIMGVYNQQSLNQFAYFRF